VTAARAGRGRPGPPPAVTSRWRPADTDATGASPAALFSVEEVALPELGPAAMSGTRFLHVRTKKIINTLPAGSRMPLRHSINAYRGCSHACVYCFARPTHAWLGLDIGRDFDTAIVVKINAVDRLRAELRAPGWSREPIAMGTNTDPYQRAEGKYRLTRGLLRVLVDAGNPFSILTKSPLVLRDLDLLTAAARSMDIRVNLSIGTLDEQVWRDWEPGAPHPARRVAAVRELRAAGVPCGVLMAPVIPGVSDRPEQLAEVAEAVIAAGADSVSPVPLHLRPGVREHVLNHLRTTDPDLGRDLDGRYRRGAYLSEPDRATIGARARSAMDGATAAAGGSSECHDDNPRLSSLGS
jgi:DNA repair photolyase